MHENKLLFLSSEDVNGAVELWDIRDNIVLKSVAEKGREVHTMAFDSKHKTMATVGSDTKIVLRDVETGEKKFLQRRYYM